MSGSSVFIISELGSNWRFGKDECSGPPVMIGAELQNAYRMIRAAKECGADAAKFQWVSDYRELMKRRKAPDSEEWAYRYVHFPAEWLPLLKAECDRVGIEFMCTAYLPQDVAVIAPFVKRFKVAAKEAGDKELMYAIQGEIVKASPRRTVIVSYNGDTDYVWPDNEYSKDLHCVSKYPCPLEELHLGEIWEGERCFEGFSDHSAHVLTGAVAVGAGARIIESHVRLHDTPKECPDFPHSLSLSECDECESRGEIQVHECPVSYAQYVQNIRTAERML